MAERITEFQNLANLEMKGRTGNKRVQKKLPWEERTVADEKLKNNEREDRGASCKIEKTYRRKVTRAGIKGEDEIEQGPIGN